MIFSVLYPYFSANVWRFIYYLYILIAFFIYFHYIEFYYHELIAKFLSGNTFSYTAKETVADFQPSPLLYHHLQNLQTF